MKISILLLAFFLISINLYCQKSGNRKIDSLINVYQKTNSDLEKSNLLYLISVEYYSINPNQGIIYGNQSLELSKKLRYDTLMIKSYLAIGVNYWAVSDYLSAAENYQKAFHIADSIKDLKFKKYILINLAILYQEQGETKKSLDCYFESLKISEKANDKVNVPIILGNIGSLYQEIKDFEKAREFYYEAINKTDSNKNKKGIAMLYGNIGNTYLFDENPLIVFQYYNLYKALEYYNHSLFLSNSIGYKRGVSIMNGNIGIVYQKLGDYYKADRYFQLALEQSNMLNDQSGVAANLDNIGTNYFLKAKNITSEAEKTSTLNKSVEYLKKAIEMFDSFGDLSSLANSYNNLSTAYSLLKDYQQSLEFFKKYIEVSDTLKATETRKEIANKVAVRDNVIKGNQIKIQNLAIEKQQTYIYIFIGTSLSVVIILCFIIYLYINKRKTNKILTDKNEKIEKANIEIASEREKSEKLLLNILPVSIADRLKAGESTIADYFEEASVMFIDLSGFTKYSSKTSPPQIVNMLNNIFVKFDNISAKYGIEKIKTIGDCYMAASGIPVPRADHAEKMAKMALEAKSIMDNFITEQGDEIKIRVGLHCGPVVAGVIGKQKFIYDLWGDTVNTASRMESTGAECKIQVTEKFKNALANYNEFSFEPRGEINVKGKGIMSTYFLESA